MNNTISSSHADKLAQRELKRKMRRRKAKKCLSNWQLYVMVLPAVLYLLIFLYKPMYGIQIAFRDFDFRYGIVDSPWVGFKQFRRLFNSYWFPVILKNTLTLSFLGLVVSFPCPIIFALMANELRNKKLKKTIQTITYLPHFISTVVMCGMVILLLSPTSGVVNTMIKSFGGEPISFLQRPELFKWVYVLSGVWQGTGWSAILYFAALSGVDQSLLEAAEIDGATRFQRIIHINFPTLIPTIVISLILSCGGLLNIGTEKVLLLQNAMNLNASEVINTYVYKSGLELFDYSFSTAASIFNSVCNCTLLVLVNNISKKVTEESLW